MVNMSPNRLPATQVHKCGHWLSPRIFQHQLGKMKFHILATIQKGADHYSRTVQLPGVLRNGIYILKYIIGENTVVDKLTVQRL
jgi:hypothetical protein